MGKLAGKTGAFLVIIGKSLNHKHPFVTVIYFRLDLDPVRESVGRATSEMLAAAGLKADAEVVPFKSKQKVIESRSACCGSYPSATGIP